MILIIGSILDVIFYLIYIQCQKISCVDCDLCNKLFKNKNSLRTRRSIIHDKKNDDTDPNGDIQEYTFKL